MALGDLLFQLLKSHGAQHSFSAAMPLLWGSVLWNLGFGISAAEPQTLSSRPRVDQGTGPLVQQPQPTRLLFFLKGDEEVARFPESSQVSLFWN